MLFDQRLEMSVQGLGGNNFGYTLSSDFHFNRILEFTLSAGTDVSGKLGYSSQIRLTARYPLTDT